MGNVLPNILFDVIPYKIIQERERENLVPTNALVRAVMPYAASA